MDEFLEEFLPHETNTSPFEEVQSTVIDYNQFKHLKDLILKNKNYTVETITLKEKTRYKGDLLSLLREKMGNEQIALFHLFLNDIENHKFDLNVNELKIVDYSILQQVFNIDIYASPLGD